MKKMLHLLCANVCKEPCNGGSPTPKYFKKMG